MKKISFYILPFFIFTLFVFAGIQSTKKTAQFKLIENTKSFVAGNPITLVFQCSSKTASADLYLIHSYSKIIVNAKNENGKLVFKLPLLFTEKTGNVNWYLISNSEKKSFGNFKITPNNNTQTEIENYLGPRTILTGNQNFTMIVTVPTDGYDNPKEDNTLVLIKDQFLENTTTESIKTAHFIAWKNIYSRTQAGKMLVSSQCEQTSTREIETDIYPSIATDFNIRYERNHDFADGNQITKLITTSITDQYGNQVSDGTLVTFYITNSSNIVLKTYAATINGVAIGQILHPDHKETYRIKAYVTGIAESPSITINYKPLIEKFPYTFSKNNRTITVGPLTSFMNQIVPNGIKVELKIIHNNQVIETKQVDSYEGKARFTLSPSFYKEKQYQFEITTLGITQKTKIISYEIH
ncbi:hypothetical protein [Flavobacterium faecale]|uniref:hypothetical protein n=1 Tax=Flavobacterium faecale TaxID=1355330 RepID=UPI003AAF02B6